MCAATKNDLNVTQPLRRRRHYSVTKPVVDQNDLEDDMDFCWRWLPQPASTTADLETAPLQLKELLQKPLKPALAEVRRRKSVEIEQYRSGSDSQLPTTMDQSRRRLNNATALMARRFRATTMTTDPRKHISIRIRTLQCFDRRERSSMSLLALRRTDWWLASKPQCNVCCNIRGWDTWLRSGDAIENNNRFDRTHAI